MFQKEKTMDKEKIKDVLSNYDDILTSIQRRIQFLEHEILDMDSILESIALPAVKLEENAGKHGRVYQDLSDLILSHEKLCTEHMHEMKDEINRLFQYMFQIRKIYECYQRLPSEEYEMLTLIYVEKNPYKVVEIDKGISRATLSRRLRSGLQMLQDMYKSS